MKGELQETAQNMGTVSRNDNEYFENFATFIICKKQKSNFSTIFSLTVHSHKTNIL